MGAIWDIHRKARTKGLHAEARAQESLVEWARFSSLPAWFGLPGAKIGDFLLAIPNGSHLAGEAPDRVRQMGFLKKAGLMEGAADLLLALPSRMFNGLFIEMKKPIELFSSPREATRAWTTEQRLFAERVKSVGYDYLVSYGWEAGLERINNHLAAGQGVIGTYDLPP